MIVFSLLSCSVLSCSILYHSSHVSCIEQHILWWAQIITLKLILTNPLRLFNSPNNQGWLRQDQNLILTMAMKTLPTCVLSSSSICLCAPSTLLLPLAQIPSSPFLLSMPCTTQNYTLWWHLLLSFSSNGSRPDFPPLVAHLATISSSLHSWSPPRWSAMVPILTSHGQLSAGPCSSSGRSTRWSGRCASILTGSSMLSLVISRSSRTLLALDPIPPVYSRQYQNLPLPPQPLPCCCT